MAARVIISYDGTPNDDDALALGKMLSRAGFALALPRLCAIRVSLTRVGGGAQHDAEQRLQRGAAAFGDTEMTRHVVIGASTGDSFGRLAEREGASVVVFGSDYGPRPVTSSPARPLSISSTVARSRLPSPPPVCGRSWAARSDRSPCLLPARLTIARGPRHAGRETGATVRE